MIRKRGALTTPVVVLLAFIAIVFATIVFYVIFKFYGSSSSLSTTQISSVEALDSLNAFTARPVVVEHNGINYRMTIAELAALAIDNPDWTPTAKAEIETQAKAYFGLDTGTYLNGKTLIGSVVSLSVGKTNQAAIFLIGTSVFHCEHDELWDSGAYNNNPREADSTYESILSNRCGNKIGYNMPIPTVSGKGGFMRIVFNKVES